MIHAPGTARNISHHTAWSCRPQSQSVLRPCRRSPPRSSRPIRSTCADVPGRLAMAAKVRKGKDSASRNIAGAVWSCQAPFRAPLHPDAGSANTRKWVGGKYIGRPIVRAGMSNRLRGRGVPECRPGGPRCIRAGGPGCPITRRPSGSGKPSHDEGLPTSAGLLRPYDRLLWLERETAATGGPLTPSGRPSHWPASGASRLLIPSRTSRPRAPVPGLPGHPLRRDVRRDAQVR